MSSSPDDARFVDLLEMIIKTAGGRDALAKAADVRAATLTEWRNGRFPRDRVTDPIDRVDSWASKNMPSPYPPPGFPPGGLRGFIAAPRPVEGEPPPCDDPVQPEGENSPGPINPSEEEASTRARPPRGRRTWGIVAGVLAVLLLVVAVVSVVLFSRGVGTPTPTVLVSGSVRCLSGAEVTGVFVGAGDTASGFADYSISGPGSATYIFSAPAGASYAVHVGCGGSKEKWLTDNRSEHFPGTNNSFVCDDRIDVAHGQKYGRCERV